MKTGKLDFLVGRFVDKVYLIVYPPYGEREFCDIDMSIGLILRDDLTKLIRIGTDIRDMWTPKIEVSGLPNNVYPGDAMEQRTRMWMQREIESDFIDEYFDMSGRPDFRNITGCMIRGLRLLAVEDIDCPFGVRVLFDDDYILSFPNSDGGTIETARFNSSNRLRNFSSLGIVVER